MSQTDNPTERPLAGPQTGAGAGLTVAAERGPATVHERRGLRQLLRDASSFGELRRTPYGAGPLALLALIAFFQFLDSFAFRFAGPEIARALEVNVGDIIGVLVIVSAVAIFAAIFAGWYADRHRRVPFVGVGTIFSGIFASLTGGTTSAFTLGSARVGNSLSEVGSAVPVYALLADYYPPDTRGRVFATFGLFQRMGTLLAPITIGLLIINFGFRTTFVVLGIPLVVLGVVAMVRLREPVRGYMERRALGADEAAARTEEEPQSFGEAWRTVWSVRTLRRFFIGDIADEFADGAVSLFFVFFLAEVYGLDALERGLVFMPAVVLRLAGTFIGGGLIDRFIRHNPGRVVTTVALFSLPGSMVVGVYALEPPLAVLVVLSGFFGFFTALIGPAASAVYSQVIPPTVRTQGLQMILLAALPGVVIGFPLLGTVQAQYGYDVLFLVSAPFLVVGTLLKASAGPFFELDMRNAQAASIAAEEWRRAKAEGRGKLLVCRDVDVEYDGVQVLFGVDFDVQEGEIIALLGTNGAGKSTLLKAISGVQEASGGAIVFDGRDVTHMPPNEIAGRGIVHMPGGRGVFPGLSVRENLLLGTWLEPDSPETVQRLSEVFEIFPVLRERADTLAGALSGGEQQQLSLAQAFLIRPRLLMIDELSLGLAPAVVAQLLDVVHEIHRRGVTVIVVEQSVNVALAIADRAIFMEKGEVKFVGRTEDLLARPDILRAVYVKGTGSALGNGRAGAASAGGAGSGLAATPDQAPAVLEVEHITKRYGGIVAVDDVSFDLQEGQVLGLMGPNGAGKTTLFDLISGYQTADGGVVRYEGVDITNLTAEQRAERKLVRRFQDARLFPSLTVSEAILIALDQHLPVRSTALSALGLPQARRAERRLRARAERLIELLQLQAYRDKFVKELSTGLRRIVDLACVLAAEPKVLLLDEPSSGIAQAESENLAPLLRRVRFETGCSMLVIEHDMPLLSSIADELVALDQGRVLCMGRPDVVLEDERVIESYLGGSDVAMKRSGSLA